MEEKISSKNQHSDQHSDQEANQDEFRQQATHQWWRQGAQNPFRGRKIQLVSHPDALFIMQIPDWLQWYLF